MDSVDKKFLLLAIEKARDSVRAGGFPAGAVVVKNGAVVGEGISVGNKLNDPTSHGEMAAIRDACKNLQTTELKETVLYASMRPCLMCFGASMWSSIPRIVFAASQEHVSAVYYGGHYNTSEINQSLLSRIDIVHFKELERDSLAVVQQWESSLD